MGNKKPLIIILVIILLLTLYIIFWLNFFGIFKLPFTSPPISQQPYQKQQQKIDQLITSIKSIKEPLDIGTVQEDHAISMGTIVDFLNQAKEALAKGDVNTARLKIGFANNSIYNLGEDSKMIPIPPEVKTRHDPKGKYMGIPIIDPKVKDIYLELIDLLVETDRDY